jgi:hypothetical protein
VGEKEIGGGGERVIDKRDREKMRLRKPKEITSNILFN